MERLMSNNNVGIITIPISKSGIVPLSNLITIISSFSKNIFLITGNEGYNFFRNDKRLKIMGFSHHYHEFFLKRIYYYLILQLKMSFYIFKTRKQIEFFIFFIGGHTLLIPTLIAHLFKKKVILLIAGSLVKTHASNNDPNITGLKILNFFTCMFADKIIVYSERVISDYSLERWTRKIVIACEHFIDVERFKIKKAYFSRDCIVGYVGRFSEEKGIMNILHAVPDIIIDKPDVKFLFIGDGDLHNTVRNYIIDNNLSDTIILHGWISHDVLPDYLNQMKLLVIPSDTEGLPNVMLEAMACGTPVLATSVGGIPSIIKNGETGFILEKNSAVCITSTIIKILDNKNSANITHIISNALQLIQNEFQFQKRAEEFKNIFDAIA